MSVLISTLSGWVVSHEDFVRNIYSNVVINFGANANATLEYSRTFFSINTPFMFNAQTSEFYDVFDEKVNKLKKRKRKLNINDSFSGTKSINEEEASNVKHKCDYLIERAQKNGYLCLTKSEEILSENNLEARLSSGRFFSELSEQTIPSSSGGNSNDYAIIVSCHGQDLVFPAGSKFYYCDVRDFPSKIQSVQVFDLILMDPPWRNKYIRRKRSKNAFEGYKMMYTKELRDLPIDSLLAQDGLVAVWCTNCSSHIQDLVNEIFPAWGIEYLATWYWMKVTKGGQPVCSFSKPPGKQPYERIIFGSKNDRGKKYHQPEDKKCIVSVPSAIHSHKPPLVDILAHYLPTSPRCLELFARYLLPHWTSCGDQVLSLQNVKLFTKKPVIIDK